MPEPHLPGPPSASGETICTLFDGDFHFGLAALVNSLVSAGYKGTVWAGYRGPLPPWVDQLRSSNGAAHDFMVTDNCRLVFVPVKTDLPLTIYKPRFMMDLLREQAQGCTYIWFFDADIFIRCAWTFFVKWQRCGVAVCQDALYHPLPDADPLRQQWKEIAAGMGLGEPRVVDQYFNGGLVGVPASQVSFVQLWQRMLERAAEMGVDLKNPPYGTREMPFFLGDQDALNVAVMYSEHPVSAIGPDGMGFSPGRPVTYHAVGPKPWRGSMLMRALAGVPPSSAAKFYFSQVSSPIRMYSGLALRCKQLECATASFIGRFYGRR